MSQWIPTPGNGENGRLPTEAESNRHRQVLVEFDDGSMATWLYNEIDQSPSIVAWTKLPDHYVPPEPEKPEKPERRRLYRNERMGAWYEVDRAIVDGEWKERSVSKGTPTALEMLAGDPDPDKAREAREVLKSYIHSESHDLSGSHAAIADAIELLKRRES